MKLVFLGAAAVVALSLAACGGHPSAVAPQSQDASTTSAVQPEPRVQKTSTAADPRDAPIPMVDGKPLWAPNSKHTAEENAHYQFAKNGQDFGAASEDDYVARAHAFVAHPPSGAQTIQRSNGDRLIYDAKANVFAVATKDGAPRTMFKPRDGAAYWTQQKDREAKRSQGDNGDEG